MSTLRWIPLLLLGSGCASLSEAARKISIVDASAVKRCRLISEFTGESDAEGRNGLDEAERRVLNEAGEYDVTHLVWGRTIVKPTRKVSGKGYQCAGGSNEASRKLARLAMGATTLLVLDLRTVGGVDTRVTKILSNIVLSSLEKVPGLRTIGQGDLATLLEVEKQKDLLDCEGAGCMAQYGGALGAELIWYGEIGRIGSQYSITATIVESATAQVSSRATVNVVADEDVVSGAVPGLVLQALEQVARPRAPARGK